jgi:iron complex outermembrane receptor protein
VLETGEGKILYKCSNWSFKSTITSIVSTDTTNKAIFAKVEKSFGKLDLEAGIRYDYTDIDSQRPNVR